MSDEKIKKNILVVEDEQDVVDLLIKHLIREGYNAVGAYNGLDGLEKLKTFKADLIILDLNMPKMGGIEFYQKICDTNAQPKYPVLVVTARASMQEIFKDLEIQGFITKPFNSTELIREIGIIVHKDIRQKQLKDSNKFVARKIFLVEPNYDAQKKITDLFKKAGYEVNSEMTGVAAIEKIMTDPPDVALINLTLEDIPGDLLVYRLQYMPKTKKTKCVLYIPRNVEQKQPVMEKISQKTGVEILKQYNDPADLLSAVDKLFEPEEV